MTELELIALRDSLVGFDDLLDALNARVVVLEDAAVPKGTYFEQIIASFEDSPVCKSTKRLGEPLRVYLIK